VAAWVFYGLTAHPKKDPFDRVVQALIFTVLVQAAVALTKIGLLAVGKRWFVWGKWDSDSPLIWSVVLAFFIGTVVSFIANSGYLHALLQNMGITRRTSYPGEWYSAFYRYKRYCVLYLKCGRRLQGWPEEWPDQCDRGHFLIQDPKWVLELGEQVAIVQSSHMLVAAADVEMVEFELPAGTQTLSTVEIKEIQKPLIAIHRKEAHNGHRSASGRLPAPESSSIAERATAAAGEPRPAESGD
jgi:hypothetical protein